MRLLVAEDEALVRDLLVRGLSESGYIVDAAGTGADALHLLRIYRYAAAIIDWRMPEMTGVDVVRAARRAHFDLPVLMLTARDAVADRVEGLDAGADDYLVKPFEFDELLARLRAPGHDHRKRSTTHCRVGQLSRSFHIRKCPPGSDGHGLLRARSGC